MAFSWPGTTITTKPSRSTTPDIDPDDDDPVYPVANSPRVTAPVGAGRMLPSAPTAPTAPAPDVISSGVVGGGFTSKPVSIGDDRTVPLPGGDWDTSHAGDTSLSDRYPGGVGGTYDPNANPDADGISRGGLDDFVKDPNALPVDPSTRSLPPPPLTTVGGFNDMTPGGPTGSIDKDPTGGGRLPDPGFGLPTLGDLGDIVADTPPDERPTGIGDPVDPPFDPNDPIDPSNIVTHDPGDRYPNGFPPSVDPDPPPADPANDIDAAFEEAVMNLLNSEELRAQTDAEKQRAEERAIQMMQQSMLDGRARMGRMGMGASGAMMGVEGDIANRAAEMAFDQSLELEGAFLDDQRDNYGLGFDARGKERQFVKDEAYDNAMIKAMEEQAELDRIRYQDEKDRLNDDALEDSKTDGVNDSHFTGINQPPAGLPRGLPEPGVGLIGLTGEWMIHKQLQWIYDNDYYHSASNDNELGQIPKDITSVADGTVHGGPGWYYHHDSGTFYHIEVPFKRGQLGKGTRIPDEQYNRMQDQRAVMDGLMTPEEYEELWGEQP